MNDAALVSALHEIKSGPYQHGLERGMTIALAASILVIGGTTMPAVCFLPGKDPRNGSEGK